MIKQMTVARIQGKALFAARAIKDLSAGLADNSGSNLGLLFSIGTQQGPVTDQVNQARNAKAAFVDHSLSPVA